MRDSVDLIRVFYLLNIWLITGSELLPFRLAKMFADTLRSLTKQLCEECMTLKKNSRLLRPKGVGEHFRQAKRQQFRTCNLPYIRYSTFVDIQPVWRKNVFRIRRPKVLGLANLK